MNLEDCTKEELIWIIQYRCFHTAKDFEFDILAYRSEKVRKAASFALERANTALKDYCELIRPYEGKPLISVPDTVLHESAEKMKIRECFLKAYKKLEKQYNVIDKRMDKILQEERSLL